MDIKVNDTVIVGSDRYVIANIWNQGAHRVFTTKCGKKFFDLHQKNDVTVVRHARYPSPKVDEFSSLPPKDIMDELRNQINGGKTTETDDNL